MHWYTLIEQSPVIKYDSTASHFCTSTQCLTIHLTQNTYIGYCILVQIFEGRSYISQMPQIQHFCDFIFEDHRISFRGHYYKINFRGLNFRGLHVICENSEICVPRKVQYSMKILIMQYFEFKRESIKVRKLVASTSSYRFNPYFDKQYSKHYIRNH